MNMIDWDKARELVNSLQVYDDVVPVVRCRDCKNCRETTDGFYFCDEWSDYTEPGVYCSYGKSVFDMEE